MTSAKELREQFHRSMPFFIALGDEIRLSIIDALTQDAIMHWDNNGPIPYAQNGLNVNEITERTSLSRPAISHHLKILKKAGLVGIREEGTANYYYLTLTEPTRQLMKLGFLLEEFL